MKRYTVGYYDGWHSDLEKGIHDVYLIAEVREKVLPVLRTVKMALGASLHMPGVTRPTIENVDALIATMEATDE